MIPVISTSRDSVFNTPALAFPADGCYSQEVATERNGLPGSQNGETARSEAANNKKMQRNAGCKVDPKKRVEFSL
jgi:hypothetical protein